MAASTTNRSSADRKFIVSKSQVLHVVRENAVQGLPELRPPLQFLGSGQQENLSPRKLASVFTRRRDISDSLPDSQSELVSALVPLTELIAAANSSKTPSGAPKTLNTAPTKPKRKRVRAKTARRREQCRNNQARYRDRQRGFVRELQNGVHELRSEIQKLTTQRHTLCYGVQAQHNIWYVAVEYFRLLRYGFLMPLDGLESSRGAGDGQDQECFLRATMAADVAIGEMSGIDALIDQWQRYSSYFVSLHLRQKQMEQQPLGIKASATLSLTITEATIRNVLPHLLPRENTQASENDDEVFLSRLASTLLGQRIDCQCTVRFVWDDSARRVTRLDSSIDLLTPLLRVLGNLADVSYVLGKALLTPAFLIGEMKTCQVKV
ncbi:unnamed protein product [Phytophthora lilii]|uniref:Unnamed protein product n=1 Tax=Phytophthora lilii TaxID=2077276 RepID=A0A9W6YHL8_9STRA|nr:unnamed protein product [Phytophthora lilii]